MATYHEWLASEDQANWEEAYLKYVNRGQLGIDDLVLDWLWHRIQFPESKEYSIFSPHLMVDAALVNVQLKLGSFHQDKVRYVRMEVFNQGSLHPDFEVTAVPESQDKRFPSVGNPFIDEPNYRWWEEYLFFKLTAKALHDLGGLDAIIEAIHRGR